MSHRRFLVALISLAYVFFCSCSDGNVEPSPTATPSAENHPVYAMIVKEKNNPYMLKMYEGFEMACAEIGSAAVYGGPDDYTAEAQIRIINQLVSQENVDAIAVAANDVDALQGSLNAAMEKGIKILSLDSAVNPKSRMIHVQQASPETIGRVLIQAAHKMIEGKGLVGLISSTEYATNQNLWISWMQKEINENPEKYKDFILLPTLYGDDNLDKSAEMTMSLLQNYSDLKVIITPSVVGMLAAGKTIAAERSPVLFTGLGLPSEMAEYIENGSCPWMYLWNPIDIGYLTAYTADALHSGVITGEINDIFVAGRIGQRVVTSSSDGGTEILLGDPVKFDIDNIGEWKLVY